MSSAVVEKITARATGANQRIVLPESLDPRVLHAARLITDLRYARVTLLGPPQRIAADAAKAKLDLSDVEMVDPLTDPRREVYVERLMALRGKKGMTQAEAVKTLADPVYFGGAMVADGRVDGMVVGSICPTKETIRSALWSVGTAAGCKTVSSCSIMQTIVPSLGVQGALIFADTGVIPEPTVEQLADTAIHAAEACRALLGAEPRVAMISFSTKGSASSPMVQFVIDTTKLAQSKRPDLKIDGELQVDAAVIPNIAARKCGDSPVAGHANVLIFPNLSCGNVAYKLVERLGNAIALGPLLLGLAKPVNDLSRGCSVEDIVLVTAITAVEAMAIKERAGGGNRQY
jgi:phosphate acetyltransferase